MHTHDGNDGGSCNRVDRGLLTSGERRNVAQRKASILCDFSDAFVRAHGGDD
jgi:hypothetical protein